MNNKSQESIDILLIENFIEDKVDSIELPIIEEPTIKPQLKKVPIVVSTIWNHVTSRANIKKYSISGIRELIRPGTNKPYQDRCLIIKNDDSSLLVKGSYDRIYNLLYDEITNQVKGFKK